MSGGVVRVGAPRAAGGFVLVDLLTALALLATMALAVFLAFRANMTTWLTVHQYAAEQQNGRAVVNQAARALRMAGYNYAPTATAPAVIYADRHEIDFFADLDNTGAAQCYRFYLSAGVVYQAEAAGGGCAASITTTVGRPLTAAAEAKAVAVTELDFGYWSAADLGGGQLTDAPLTLSDRSLVRRVSITVKVRALSPTETPVGITTQAVVRQGG